jgi:acyl carrier protein
MSEEQSLNIEEDIRELVAEILEVEPEEINADAEFVKDLGMDSMMALEILASIEKKYKIAIPEDDLAKFTDLRTTVSLVKTMLNDK